MTAASTLPLCPSARSAGICWDHRLVPLRWSGTLKQRQPVRLLPRWRLAPTIKPVVGGATRTAKGGDDLRCCVDGKGLLERHNSNHSRKRNVGNAENNSCNRRQCRHNEDMKEKKFRTKKAAEEAADEIMDNGWAAGVRGNSESGWRVDAHGYANERSVRITYFLGVDGKLHEYSRKEVAA